MNDINIIGTYDANKMITTYFLVDNPDAKITNLEMTRLLRVLQDLNMSVEELLSALREIRNEG